MTQLFEIFLIVVLTAACSILMMAIIISDGEEFRLKDKRARVIAGAILVFLVGGLALDIAGLLHF